MSVWCKHEQGKTCITIAISGHHMFWQGKNTLTPQLNHAQLACVLLKQKYFKNVPIIIIIIMIIILIVYVQYSQEKKVCHQMEKF